MPVRQVMIALVIAACIVLVGLFVTAWPATAPINAPVTPTTYGPPGPTGGPQ